MAAAVICLSSSPPPAEIWRRPHVRECASLRQTRGNLIYFGGQSDRNATVIVPSASSSYAKKTLSDTPIGVSRCRSKIQNNTTINKSTFKALLSKSWTGDRLSASISRGETPHGWKFLFHQRSGRNAAKGQPGSNFELSGIPTMLEFPHANRITISA